jgi:DNA-directed RNA polymerase subunit N (RpoN/RPB10)
MIIPVKCFTCGKVLADKYQYYERAVRERKVNKNEERIVYLTPDNMKKTYEAEILDELGLKKMCCRRHMLTHVDVL